MKSNFTFEVLQAWAKFVNRLGKQIEALAINQRAAYSKLEGYAARFALVFHCI